VTTAVQALVTAANNALSTISEYGDNKPGSKAVLRGDSALRDLAGQVLDAVSQQIDVVTKTDPVTGAVRKGTASDAGLELTRDGRIAFDSAAFTAALKADPGLARRLVDGDGTSPGVARRLLAVAERATNGTTGSLVGLAGGMDRQVTELQSRIDAWDLRLELRQQALTKQFTALESALGGLQNKSMWLSSQLANLPTWSRS
jgi:flagellar hook-associated protein 2